MKNTLKMLTMMFTCIIGLHNLGYSQSTYEIENTEDVDMLLLGTSSIHDWEMAAKTVTGEAKFVFKSDSAIALIALDSLTFVLEVEDLESDHSKLRKNAYKALKSDEFENIQYKLSSSIIFSEKGGYLLITFGELTIAGVTKEIEMDVHVVVNENSTITCTGTYHLKMTDYGVKPPSFMFGAMKTGDDITLEYAVVYKKSV